MHMHVYAHLYPSISCKVHGFELLLTGVSALFLTPFVGCWWCRFEETDMVHAGLLPGYSV